jgi:hypothetical protein
MLSVLSNNTANLITPEHTPLFTYNSYISELFNDLSLLEGFPLTKKQLCDYFERLRYNYIEENIINHPIWNIKLETSKHFNLKNKHKFNNYTILLPKKTNNILKNTTLKQMNSKLYLLNDYKLIQEGGDPLIPEIEGGLSLEFIYNKIYNSGLGEEKKKPAPPLYFKIQDSGRNISNMLFRVYRIVNKCD